VDERDVVGDVVFVDETVVVRDDVTLVVTVDVLVEVADDVGDVVGLLVCVVVCEVVGVVRTQPLKDES
jgi:hypothetical protein